jgi:hypothetical protein
LLIQQAAEKDLECGGLTPLSIRQRTKSGKLRRITHPTKAVSSHRIPKFSLLLDSWIEFFRDDAEKN